MRTRVEKTKNPPKKSVSPSSLARSNAAISGLNVLSGSILHLQRTIGNQAVQRMLRAGVEEPSGARSALQREYWDSKPNPRDPSNPNNTLSAIEMYRRWQNYWTPRFNRAVVREQKVREKLWSEDAVAASNHEWEFEHLGKRDALGPEYRAARDEYDFCRAVTLYGPEVRAELETRIDGFGKPMTIDQVNDLALEITSAHHVFDLYMAPLVYGAIAYGALSGSSVRVPPRVAEPPEPPPAAKPPEPTPAAKPPVRGGSTAPPEAAPPAPTAAPPAVTPRRLLNRSTPDRYLVTDSVNPRLSAEAHLEAGGELSITLRTKLGGDSSPLLRGTEQFQAMLKYFHGQVKGVRGAWSYGDNLAKFNELTAAGKSPEEAALGTWTGEQAANSGFAKVKIRNLEGPKGNYTKVDVLFYP